MVAPAPRTESQSRTLIAILALWVALYFGIRLILESNPELDRGLRLALAIAPTPVFGLFLWRFVQGIRSADELERRIQLEALAVAFPLGLVLLTTLGLLQRAVELKFEDWSYNHIWPWFTLFYLMGLALARKRYA